MPTMACWACERGAQPGRKESRSQDSGSHIAPSSCDTQEGRLPGRETGAMGVTHGAIRRSPKADASVARGGGDDWRHDDAQFRPVVCVLSVYNMFGPGLFFSRPLDEQQLRRDLTWRAWEGGYGMRERRFCHPATSRRRTVETSRLPGMEDAGQWAARRFGGWGEAARCAE